MRGPFVPPDGIDCEKLIENVVRGVYNPVYGRTTEDQHLWGSSSTRDRGRCGRCCVRVQSRSSGSDRVHGSGVPVRCGTRTRRCRSAVHLRPADRTGESCRGCTSCCTSCCHCRSSSARQEGRYQKHNDICAWSSTQGNAATDDQGNRPEQRPIRADGHCTRSRNVLCRTFRIYRQRRSRLRLEARGFQPCV